MKTILTILFFLDTLALSVLSFLLLRFIDAGSHGATLLLLLLLYACCIFLLGYLLFHFLKLPGDKINRSFFD
jgi:hypothetical protein